MNSVRRSVRKMKARKQMYMLDKELNEFQECLNEFQASFRRKESVRFRNGQKRSCNYNQESLERELRQQMTMEDSVGLGAAKVLEVSKTLALSCARLEALKTELSAVSRRAAA